MAGGTTVSGAAVEERGRAMLTVESSAALDFALAEDGGDLCERFDIVVRIEKRETSCKEAKQDDTRRPDVECCDDRNTRQHACNRSDVAHN